MIRSHFAVTPLILVPYGVLLVPDLLVVAFAGEHLSDAFYGYMNAAAETGRLAVRALAERI